MSSVLIGVKKCFTLQKELTPVPGDTNVQIRKNVIALPNGDVVEYMHHLFLGRCEKVLKIFVENQGKIVSNRLKRKWVLKTIQVFVNNKEMGSD